MQSVRVGDLRSQEPRRRVSAQVGGARRKATAGLVRLLAALAAVACVAAVCVCALGFTGAFAVEEVTVSGCSHLTESELSSLAAVPEGSTLVTVDAAGIEERLKTNAWVQDASVNRLFPNTLELAITEREIAAVVAVPTATQTEQWAISSDGVWLVNIPDAASADAASVASQVYTDAESSLRITDVPYGVNPQVGAACTDESVLNALAIVSGLSTSLAESVTNVSAASADNTILTLDSGVQIAFGTATDIRAKERVCQELLEEHPDSISYINVRVVERPTYRSL